MGVISDTSILAPSTRLSAQVPLTALLEAAADWRHPGLPPGAKSGTASRELAQDLAVAGLVPRSGWYRVGPCGVPPPALAEAARLALLPPAAARRFLHHARRCAWNRCGLLLLQLDRAMACSLQRRHHAWDQWHSRRSQSHSCLPVTMCCRWQRQGPPLAQPLGAHCAEALPSPAGSGNPGGGKSLPQAVGPAHGEVPAELQAFLLALCEASMARYGAYGGSYGGQPPGRRPAKRRRPAIGGPGRVPHQDVLPEANIAEAHANGHQGSPSAGAGAVGPRRAATQPPGAQSDRTQLTVRVDEPNDAEAEAAWQVQAAQAVRASEQRCWQALHAWLARRSSAQLVAGRCARFWRSPMAKRRCHHG